MKPHRKLVREGPMRYKLHHSTRRFQPGFHNGLIFLFTDCLLVTEPVTISMTKLFDSSTAPRLRPIEVLSLNNSAVLDIMEEYKERNGMFFVGVSDVMFSCFCFYIFMFLYYIFNYFIQQNATTSVYTLCKQL